MTGPRRRGGSPTADTGLNYTVVGASASPEVLAFPPEGFRAAEYRHRVGSGAARFDLAGRALMTWGALRGAGFGVTDVRAERGAEGRFLPDGTPWITAGMTAVVREDGAEAPEPVKVVRVIDDPGRIGYVYGSRPGNPDCVERMLLLEHDEDDGVHLTLRSLWQEAGSRWRPSTHRAELRRRRLDERIVRALHPSNAA